MPGLLRRSVHRVSRAPRAAAALIPAAAALFGALSLAAAPAFAQTQEAAALLNPGFESGSTAGWTVQNAPLGGGVNVVRSYTSAAGRLVSYAPVEGAFFALLDPGQTNAYTMVSQPFSAVPGQKISGHAFFKANDFLPYNDEGQVRVINTMTGEVATVFSASVSSVGSLGSTPWRAWTYTVPAEGVYRIEARVANKLNSGVDSVLGLDGVTLSAPPNRPPVVSAGPDYSVVEDGSVLLVGSATDPDNDPLTFEWDLDGDGAFEAAGREVNFSAVGIDGPAERPVTLRVSDGREGGVVTSATRVMVVNAAPVAAITGPGSGALFAVNTPVAFSGLFTDPGAGDSHQAAWSFSATINGLPFTQSVAGAVSAEGRKVSASYSFAEPGVYSVSLAVTDDDGATGTTNVLSDPAAGELPAYVVVYDPSAGFVTGGGWLSSPASALVSRPEATGKTSFGFVSRYKKGTSVPSGATVFRFHAGDLEFVSTAYEYMVLSDSRVQYKGVGTIDCGGDYGFLLTATDGRLAGSGQPDRLRIRVWDRVTGATVYDNQPGTADDAPLSGGGTLLSGGNIVIHSR